MCLLSCYGVLLAFNAVAGRTTNQPTNQPREQTYQWRWWCWQQLQSIELRRQQRYVTTVIAPSYVPVTVPCINTHGGGVVLPSLPCVRPCVCVYMQGDLLPCVRPCVCVRMQGDLLPCVRPCVCVCMQGDLLPCVYHTRGLLSLSFK